MTTAPTRTEAPSGNGQGRQPLRVAIANDYELVVKGLEAMLAPFSDRIQVVDLQTGNTPDVPADLVLFDTFAAYRRSLDRIDEMADRPHLGKTVLYTWDLPPAFADELGDRDVDAIILKSMTGERLVEALEQTAAGNPPSLDDQSITSSSITLTDRELEVLALVAVGSSNAEIAQQLYLSIDTVKTHLRKLYGKLGVRNRTEAALRAPEFGLRRRAESPLVDA